MTGFKTKAAKALGKHPQFKKLIQKHGEPVWPTRGGAFRSLVRSIAHQQVTGKAAESVLKRFLALFPGTKFPTPEEVLAVAFEKLRSVGFSGQKASYIHNLAEHFVKGDVDPEKFPKMTNEELIESLTKVKGIGVWTVQMFLIFTLMREDVLPTLDLGVKKGFQIVYDLRSLPDHQRMEKLAKDWRKHASIASWYMWRAADEAKIKTKPTVRKKLRQPGHRQH